MRACNDVDNVFSGYLIDCPGCGMAHFLRTVPKGQYPCWKFDGNMEKPTFSPSVRSRWGDVGDEKCCHFYLEKGVFRFLDDCTHENAGKRMPMEKEE